MDENDRRWQAAHQRWFDEEYLRLQKLNAHRGIGIEDDDLRKISHELRVFVPPRFEAAIDDARFLEDPSVLTGPHPTQVYLAKLEVDELSRALATDDDENAQAFFRKLLGGDDRQNVSRASDDERWQRSQQNWFAPQAVQVIPLNAAVAEYLEKLFDETKQVLNGRVTLPTRTSSPPTDGAPLEKSAHTDMLGRMRKIWHQISADADRAGASLEESEWRPMRDAISNGDEDAFCAIAERVLARIRLAAVPA